jgi:hypothetical protein
MPRIVSARAMNGFRLEIVFADGVRGVIALEDRLFGPVFQPLRDPAYFARVAIDEFGAVCWPNGADLAPDALYERLRATNVAV